MTSPLLKLREAMDAFSPTEQEAARQILERPELVEQLSVHDLAKKTFVSPSTIVRLCHHAGYSGYKEFRKTVCAELLLRQQNKRIVRREPERSDSLEQIVEKITYRNISSLEETQSLLDMDVLRQCLAMIHSARFIYLFGMGESLCTAKDAYLKFLRLGKPCFVNEDFHAQLLQARNATPQDLGLVFSYSGDTEEVITCMRALRENKAPIIAITRCVNSPVAALADQKLYITASEALFRSGAAASRIAQLNIVDILYTALANDKYELSADQISRTDIRTPNAGPAP